MLDRYLIYWLLQQVLIINSPCCTSSLWTACRRRPSLSWTQVALSPRQTLLRIDHYFKTSLVKVQVDNQSCCFLWHVYWSLFEDKLGTSWLLVLMLFCGIFGILTWKRPPCWSLHSHRLSYPPQLGSGQPMKQMVEALITSAKTEWAATVLVVSGNSKLSVKPTLNNRHFKFWTEVNTPNSSTSLSYISLFLGW